MRIIVLLQNILRRQYRSRVNLLLTLFTAPVLVVFYWLFFNTQTSGVKLVIFNCLEQKKSINKTENRITEKQIVDCISGITGKKDGKSFRIEMVENCENLNLALLDEDALFGMILSDTSGAKQNAEKQITITFVGNASRPAFRAAVYSVQKGLNRYFQHLSGEVPPVRFEEKALGISGTLTPFDAYVPGLLVFAIIMQVFSTAMLIAREVESGMLERLKMTRIRIYEIMTAVGIVQLILGVIAVSLTFITARTLGFQNAGTTSAALLLVALACLSSVGIGLAVAGLSRTVSVSFLISSVTMFILVLFSGIIFPRPEVELFSFSGRIIGLCDLLPTTHLGIGLEKVLVLGLPVKKIVFELTALLLLSVFYFTVGILIFSRTGSLLQHGLSGDENP